MQFRYGFGNALEETESDDLYERLTIPSPGDHGWRTVAEYALRWLSEQGIQGRDTSQV
ncbi:hypothetical protein HEP87_62185 [Streptomyces sp. S1D4-11]